MIIISFDVGIRNLAYSIINVNEETINTHNIIDWDVLDLCEKEKKACNVDNITIGINMMKKLDVLLKNFNIDKVIIENQIGQNAIKMKTVQGMLNMYFIMKGFDNDSIINYNAIHKLKRFLNGKKTTYNERKKLSKIITEKLCVIYYKDKLSYFKSFKKKDDLADCLLQCIDYLKKLEYINDDFYSQINIFD